MTTVGDLVAKLLKLDQGMLVGVIDDHNGFEGEIEGRMVRVLADDLTHSSGARFRYEEQGENYFVLAIESRLVPAIALT